MASGSPLPPHRALGGLKGLLEQLAAEAGRVEAWGNALFEENLALAAAAKPSTQLQAAENSPLPAAERKTGAEGSAEVVFKEAASDCIHRVSSVGYNLCSEADSGIDRQPSVGVNLCSSVQPADANYGAALRHIQSSSSVHFVDADYGASIGHMKSNTSHAYGCSSVQFADADHGDVIAHMKSNGSHANSSHAAVKPKLRRNSSMASLLRTFSLRHDLAEREIDAELSIWFEGITTSECRALSPHQIEALFIAADGQCFWNAGYISGIVLELRQVTEELAPYSDTAASSLMSECPPDHLTFHDFVLLMTWTDMKPFLNSEQKFRILQIREVLIRQSVEQMVLNFSGLPPVGRLRKPAVWKTLLDPFIGFVVCVNAVTLGVSADSEWTGWAVMEFLFTMFYCLEIVLKITIGGPFAFFRGEDSIWNWFDCGIVGLALFDVVFTQVAGEESDLNNFTMIRLARLAKVTRLMRLIRLLRFRVFKELLLMIRGVVAGIRTIAWAFVLLATLIYIVGVMLRQTVGEDQILAGTTQPIVLFNSVAWSMSTVFRCFTADCTLTDGTSLLPFLYDKYGYKFFLPYTLVSLFVLFGIFNLIMAVFVENVTESAKRKRQLTEDDERALVVKKLSQLVMKFGSWDDAEHGQDDQSAGPSLRKHLERKPSAISATASGTLTSSLSHYSRRAAQTLRLNGVPDDLVAAPSSLHFQYGGKITRKMFNDVLSDRSTQYIFDDLEIHGDRTELFDVLDADRSGSVEVSQLICGLLKLRSRGADKTDTVSIILGIHSIQKQVTLIMETILANETPAAVSNEQARRRSSSYKADDSQSVSAYQLIEPIKSRDRQQTSTALPVSTTVFPVTL